MLAPDQAGPVPLWPGSLHTVGDQKVFLRSAGGDGEPVLCVHGLEGSSANWTDLMALLLPEFASSAVDLPGFGLSPPSEAGYSITAQAEAVAAVIEHVCGGPVHLIGNSLGGAVSVRVAARRPDLVRTLTLISPVLPDRRPDPFLFRFPLLCVPGLGGFLMRQTVRIPPELRVRATAAAICYDASGLHPARLGDHQVAGGGAIQRPALAGRLAGQGQDTGHLRQPRPVRGSAAGRARRPRLPRLPGYRATRDRACRSA
jgi:pimeloyl-ACP methyl ester carboxylesterase